MKGIVFTEFLDMVEKNYGYDVVDQIITASELESEGIYTATGTYHHSEIVQLLTRLSDKVNMDGESLLKAFGLYIFDTFLAAYPHFFNSVDNAFDFLESIDSHIHVDVMKLYPAATLPKFVTSTDNEGHMRMVYQSERKMASFAEGLIEKAITHYGQPCTIAKKNLKADGSEVEFIITKV